MTGFSQNTCSIKIFLFVLCAGLLSLPFCLSSSLSHGTVKIYKDIFPPVKPVVLKAAARLEEGAVPECSGIVMSRRLKNICWAVGDSGNGSWMYRFTVKVFPGDVLSLSPVEKIHISGMGNRDWEDIAAGPKGTLYIGDTGNNFSHRSDLAVLKVSEPACENNSLKETRFSFAYKEQVEQTVQGNAFDAEALFSFHGKIYLFTKRRNDSLTSLYRFNHLKANGKNVPVLLGHLSVDDLVTGADCLPSENLVALLTYKSIWLLQAARGDAFLSGKKWRLPIRAGQCEGITFLDARRLLVCNESGEFFIVKRSSFSASRGRAGR